MKKSEFIDNILTIIKKYPQIDENGIIYSFAGSIGLMLLGLCDKRLVNKLNVENYDIKKLYQYKISPLFSKFYRTPSDYDIEVYRQEVYGFSKEKSKKTIEKKEIVLDCFTCDITKTKKTLYSIYLKGQKIFVEDFKKNLGYKLMTYTSLNEDKFKLKKDKYIKKYKKDFSILLKIFFKYFGEERTKYHILSNFNLVSKTQCKQYFERINLLKLKYKYKTFLFSLTKEAV